MNYRKFGGMDWEVSALGFGCMRFPVVDGNSGRIEENTAAEMLYLAIDQGLNYIDTAFPYHDGRSESFVGRTLQGAYRDKVKLATKLPSWKIEKTEDFDFYLNDQLERLLTEQIDCYLLHALDKKSWTKIESLGVLDWAEKARADGRIKHLGFSFHDELSVFKSILDVYQKWDFCMIQHNYMDQDFQAGNEGLEYAANMGLGVVIMEPLRGGRLVDPPGKIQVIWDQAEMEHTPAEWSFQWLWNKPQISVVLSGMSTLDQVQENLNSAARSGIGSLNDNDLRLVSHVKETYQDLALIPCTSCNYCLPCPEGVDIPRILKIYNDGIMYDKIETSKTDYNQWVPADAKGDNCAVCGECEEQCPQDIQISDWIARIHQEYAGLRTD
jgi:predicted aldo/keto reductase-like oxidoreductase